MTGAAAKSPSVRPKHRVSISGKAKAEFVGVLDTDVRGIVPVGGGGAEVGFSRALRSIAQSSISLVSMPGDAASSPAVFPERRVSICGKTNVELSGVLDADAPGIVPVGGGGGTEVDFRRARRSIVRPSILLVSMLSAAASSPTVFPKCCVSISGKAKVGLLDACACIRSGVSFRSAPSPKYSVAYKANP